MARFFLSVVILLTVCSCDEAGEIGADFFEETSIRTVTVDTSTVRLQTVTFEKVSTAGAARILVGRVNDPDLGIIEAQPFLQISPHVNSDLVNRNTVYLRTTLSLIYDRYSYYDTLQPIDISVHALSENIELNDDNTLYNNSTFDYLPERLGSVLFSPRPNQRDTVEIPLEDVFGRQLYKLAKEGSSTITDVSEFRKFFKGLTLTPFEGHASSIVGFSPSVLMRVYYQDRAVFPATERYLSFSARSGDLYFNKVSANRESTALRKLVSTRNPLSSFESSGRSYIQGSTGLGMRVEVPYLNEVKSDDPNLVISSSRLQLYPVPRSQSRNTPLPQSLKVYYVNFRNEVLSEYGAAKLVDDPYSVADQYYDLDMSSFVRAQLAQQEFNNNALLLTLEDSQMAAAVTRVYTDAPQNNRSTRLEFKIVTVRKNQ